jgi:group I intron endonuclease
MSKQGIYRIRNLVDNKVYIGSTINFANRKSVHFSCLRNGKHENPYLQASFNKHGEQSFLFEILEITEGLNQVNLLIVEQRYFDKARCFDRELGYNINPIAAAPPRNIEGCRLGGSRGGVFAGARNVKDGTLKRATAAALDWKKRNPGKVLEINTAASAKAKQYWDENPEERTSQLKKAQASAKQSNSKNWVVITPTGDEIPVTNMSEFCRLNGLAPSVMSDIAKGKRKSQKGGWRCRYA